MQTISSDIKRSLHEASTEAIQAELKERGLGVYPLNFPFKSIPEPNEIFTTKPEGPKYKARNLPEVRQSLQAQHSDNSNHG